MSTRYAPGLPFLVLAALAACSPQQGEPAPDAGANPSTHDPGLTSNLPVVRGISAQPLRVHVTQLRQALQNAGAPLPAGVVDALDQALNRPTEAEVVSGVQQALDPMCLVGVHVNPESRTKVSGGSAPRELVQNGWRTFLIKVHNEAGVTAPLGVTSPEALPLPGSPAQAVPERWLSLDLYRNKPLEPNLLGTPLEYAVLLLYSRDAGQRVAVLSFDVGPGTQSPGGVSEITMAFEAAAAIPVKLSATDRGQPAVVSVTIKDAQQRVYPARTKRLAPDFDFQDQIYRGDGDTLYLPEGEYRFEVARGPETIPEVRTVVVADAGELQTVPFAINRWVDPAAEGWWSGDQHIHSAGCGHYMTPSCGVDPADILRHLQGEDLRIGCSLNWAPCASYQSQFFTGGQHPASLFPHLLRYDIEVSGFGCHQSGHLCLLNMQSQVFPGGGLTNGWPTLGLNVIRWAKQQGAIVSTAHSGLGLEVSSTELPNTMIPPFANVGAAEFIVDVTHRVPGPGGNLINAVDLFATCDTPASYELNMWYHVLNCGFRPRISGETDFPCLSDDRVGAGRTYVKLDGPGTVDNWLQGLKKGRSYVSDGRSHLLGFTVDEVEVGTSGSEVLLPGPRSVNVSARVAAWLPVQADPVIAVTNQFSQPFWTLERARINLGRQVAVELIVNGRAVEQRAIVADGSMNTVQFTTPIKTSSWVALRILPSSHTNPIFVLVGQQPIRASRESAQWCLLCVDQCWRQKRRFIADAEYGDAVAAYDHARNTYRQILQESPADTLTPLVGR